MPEMAPNNMKNDEFYDITALYDKNQKFDIHEAIETNSGRLEVVALILKSHPEAPAWAKLKDKKFGSLALHHTLGYGKPSAGFVDLVLLLMHLNPFSVRTKNNYGNLPMHRLGALEKYKEARELIFHFYQDGAVVPNHNGQLPIHFSASHGYIHTTKLLLEHKPIQQLKARDKRGWLPIHYACENSHYEIIRLFVEEYPECLQHQTKAGNLPIHVLISRILKNDDPTNSENTILLLRNLIDHYPECLDVQNAARRTPLHLALERDECSNSIRSFLYHCHPPVATRILELAIQKLDYQIIHRLAISCQALDLQSCTCQRYDSELDEGRSDFEPIHNIYPAFEAKYIPALHSCKCNWSHPIMHQLLHTSGLRRWKQEMVCHLLRYCTTPNTEAKNKKSVTHEHNMDDLKDQNDQLQAMLQKQTARSQLLLDENEQLKDKIRSRGGKASLLNQTLEDAKIQQIELKMQLDRETQHVNSLKQRLEDGKKEKITHMDHSNLLANLSKKLDVLEAQNDELQNALDQEMTSSEKDAKINVDTSASLLLQLEKKVDALQAQNDELQIALGEEINSIQELAVNYQNLVKESKSKDDEMCLLHQKLENTKVEQAKDKQRIAEMTELIRTLQNGQQIKEDAHS